MVKVCRESFDIRRGTSFLGSRGWWTPCCLQMQHNPMGRLFWHPVFAHAFLGGTMASNRMLPSASKRLIAPSPVYVNRIVMWFPLWCCVMNLAKRRLLNQTVLVRTFIVNETHTITKPPTFTSICVDVLLLLSRVVYHWYFVYQSQYMTSLSSPKGCALELILCHTKNEFRSMLWGRALFFVKDDRPLCYSHTGDNNARECAYERKCLPIAQTFATFAVSS